MLFRSRRSPRLDRLRTEPHDRRDRERIDRGEPDLRGVFGGVLVQEPDRSLEDLATCRVAVYLSTPAEIIGSRSLRGTTR